MNPNRFQLKHGDKNLTSHPSFWEAREAGVAYMRKNFVSPLTVVDTEDQTDYGVSTLHIQAYEGSPEVVAARRLIAKEG